MQIKPNQSEYVSVNAKQLPHGSKEHNLFYDLPKATYPYLPSVLILIGLSCKSDLKDMFIQRFFDEIRGIVHLVN